MNFLLRLLKKIEPPSGPCRFCGKLTYQHNSFLPNDFRHDHCLDKEAQRRFKESREREQIELIKTAMRELEQEKAKP